MRIILSLLLIILGTATVAAVYVAGNVGGWWLPKREPAELAALLAEAMETVVPDGAGPFPVVIQFHGCGGQTDPDGDIQPIMREYAAAAREAGVGAVIVDSLEPRGIDRSSALTLVCGGVRLRGTERAGDVLAALDYVRDLDWVDPSRIALAGWSHGGWAIMDLMSMDLETTLPRNLAFAPPEKLDGVAAIHLTYPYTGFPARTRENGWAWTSPKVRVVLAGEDTLAPETEIRAAIARMRDSGVDVSETVIAGVTHAFDETKLEPGSSFRVDPAAAAEARAAYAAWLAEVLDAAPTPAPAPAAPADVIREARPETRLAPAPEVGAGAGAGAGAAPEAEGPAEAVPAETTRVDAPAAAEDAARAADADADVDTDADTGADAAATDADAPAAPAAVAQPETPVDAAMTEADLSDGGAAAVPDAEETDAEETDAEETDAEETDAEETDAEETDAPAP